MNGVVMRAVVVYESMYGNTRAIAEAIGEGIGSAETVSVVPVSKATPQVLAGVDLIVVGGPTHAWTMSRPNTRQSAVATAAKPHLGLVLEPGAEGPGLREWFESLGAPAARAVAFDTRLKAPAALTGRASRRIDQMLREHGYQLAAQPQSFFVNKRNQLLPGEIERARAWGSRLAAAMSAS